MKIWVTKYALTKGIQELNNFEVCTTINVNMVSTRTGYSQSFHKPHWHATEAEAKAQANKMVANKIDSLKKSLKKLESKKF